MRVVLNRQSTLGPRTGIGHYAAELLRALRTQAGPDEIHAYPSGWPWRLQGGQPESKADGESCPTGVKVGGSAAITRTLIAPTLSAARRVFSHSAIRTVLRSLQTIKFRHFQAVCRREQYDLYHEPNILPMPCDCPTVATLHDLSVVAHPEWHPIDRVRQHERHFERALRQCAHFLTGSNFTRQEIIRELGVLPERVTRVYHGIREGLAPMPADVVAAGLKALKLPARYLLHVGTLEPRKNLEMLVRAYCGLPVAVRERCPLLLVGKWGWNTKALAALLDGSGQHRGVLHIGYLAEEHLSLLYNGARALVFPSHYEGFGLPPLEMMACGGAVISSTAGAVVEVVGPDGYFIDAQDEGAWQAAMHRAILDDDWIEELRRRQRQNVDFTWRRCAEKTLEVYRKVLGITKIHLRAA